jgi:hypothetical protein
MSNLSDRITEQVALCAWALHNPLVLNGAGRFVWFADLVANRRNASRLVLPPEADVVLEIVLDARADFARRGRWAVADWTAEKEWNYLGAIELAMRVADATMQDLALAGDPLQVLELLSMAKAA